MKKNKREYSTVVDDEGENYREIAAIMSELGYQMNHSSARNYVLRIMQKFASAYVDMINCDVRRCDAIDRLSRDPMFQRSIASTLYIIEYCDRT